MAVSLTLNTGYTTGVRAWNRFVMHAQPEAVQSHKLVTQILTEKLKAYNAWTNWEDADDPIWFADADSLTQFVLTWG
jgi:hypothetical protein